MMRTRSPVTGVMAVASEFTKPDAVAWITPAVRAFGDTSTLSIATPMIAIKTVTIASVILFMVNKLSKN